MMCKFLHLRSARLAQRLALGSLMLLEKPSFLDGDPDLALVEHETPDLAGAQGNLAQRLLGIKTGEVVGMT